MSRQVVSLDRNDTVLYGWKKYMLSKKENMSDWIRYALNVYIHSGTFADLGAVVPVPLDKPERFTLNFSKEADIQDWINSLKENGISAGDAIKTILVTSIHTVKEVEEQYIPSRNVIMLEKLSVITHGKSKQGRGDVLEGVQKEPQNTTEEKKEEPVIRQASVARENTSEKQALRHPDPFDLSGLGLKQ